MSTCRSCGAEIRWVPNVRTGTIMPLDAEPVPTGNIILLRYGDRDRGDVVTKDDPRLTGDRERYVSHFATCPNADKYRGRRP